MTAKYDYFFGPDEVDRRTKYAKSFLPEYQANGDDIQRRIGAVETAFQAETGILLPEGYASGWRPSSVNEATSNAAQGSKHLTANAGDRRDTVNGEFAWWCMRNMRILEVHQLYMEHPVATTIRAWKAAKDQKREPTPWCHLQSIPPASHNRIYFPDTRSVAEWNEFKVLGGLAGMDYGSWLSLQPATEEVVKKGKVRQVPGAHEFGPGDDVT